MKILPLALILLWQVDIPFKNADEFVVTVDIKYKPKVDENAPNTYSVNGDRKDRLSGELSPYLVVNLTQLKLQPDELRIRAVNSKDYTIFKRKTSKEDIHIDMGFVDDLKSGAVPNEVTVYFMNAEKKDVRKIGCTVLSDGTFQVNGKWNGKF
ncbi:MAG TPA: hypothetical protein VL728_06285 [Cyclobacteriaceae bacterium]|jgi:hypothetical protein|nr:hypothetical protein [Cyclobacteriaceae bacterium]